MDAERRPRTRASVSGSLSVRMSRHESLDATPQAAIGLVLTPQVRLVALLLRRFREEVMPPSAEGDACFKVCGVAPPTLPLAEEPPPLAPPMGARRMRLGRRAVRPARVVKDVVAPSPPAAVARASSSSSSEDVELLPRRPCAACHLRRCRSLCAANRSRQLLHFLGVRSSAPDTRRDESVQPGVCVERPS